MATSTYNLSVSGGASGVQTASVTTEQKGYINGYRIIYPELTLEDTASDIVSLDDLPPKIKILNFTEDEESSGNASSVSYRIMRGGIWEKVDVNGLKTNIEQGYRGQIKYSVYGVERYSGENYWSSALPLHPTKNRSFSFASACKITIEYIVEQPAAKVYYGFNGDYQLCELRFGNNGEWTCPEIYFGTSNQWVKIDQH